MPFASSIVAANKLSLDAGSIAEQEQPRDRSLQGNVQGCVQPQSLQTPFEADTVAFGTMYTVQAHADPISIITMEISANPIGNAMDVEIYTKLGNYEGAEMDASQWTKIVDTTITPAREGRGTIIPPNDFDSFTMNPNELRAFFVSLKSSDLRYRRAEGLIAGQPFISDGYLSVNVGIGLAEYSFSNLVFPERIFIGVFHYSHSTDCDAPSSKSLVTFSFHARPKGRAASRTEIIDEMDTRMREALTDLLDTDLAVTRAEHEIHFESIDTVTSNLNRDNCPVTGWSDCVLLDSKVTVSHLDTITGGQLQFLLLNQGKDVVKHIKEGPIDASYAGFYTLQTSVNIAFRGVPYGVPMTDAQKLFVEQTTTEYLEEKTVGKTNAEIIGSKITNQRGPEFAQSRRLRSLQEDDNGWIELSVDVLAVLVPPFVGNGDFISVVTSAFRGGNDEYIGDLKLARHRPGSPVQGDAGNYFIGIKQVKVSDPKDISPTSNGGNGANKNDMDDPLGNDIFGLDQNVFIGICLGGIVFTVIWIWCVFCKTRQKPEFAYVDSNDQPRRRSSVLFGSGDQEYSQPSKKGSRVGQAIATTEVESPSKKDTDISGKTLIDRSSNRSRSESIERHGTSHSRSKSRASSGGNPETSKSTTRPERSASKVNGRGRSSEGKNVTQSEKNLRSTERSSHKRSEPNRGGSHSSAERLGSSTHSTAILSSSMRGSPRSTHKAKSEGRLHTSSHSTRSARTSGGSTHTRSKLSASVRSERTTGGGDAKKRAAEASMRSTRSRVPTTDANKRAAEASTRSSRSELPPISKKLSHTSQQSSRHSRS